MCTININYSTITSVNTLLSVDEYVKMRFTQISVHRNPINPSSNALALLTSAHIVFNAPLIQA